MSRIRLVIPLVLSIVSLVIASGGSGADLPAAGALETIKADDLRSGLYFLASDAMAGRAIASPTNEIAARYLSHRFELMGLKPSKDGRFLQTFNVVQGRLGEPNRLEVRSAETDKPIRAMVREDFYPSKFSAAASARAPVVFAGYGITAPEHGYDDYAGIDASGAFVLILTSEPGRDDPESPFDGVVHSDYSRELYKIQNAQAHGAKGVLLITDVADSPRNDLSRSARRTWPEDGSEGPYGLEIWTDMIQIPAAHISDRLADSIVRSDSRRAIRRKIDSQYQPHSFRVPAVEISLEAGLSRKATPVSNVLAYLPGSDPELQHEAVIVSAHFDHVGVANEQIYNGADDDASGTVGLLEIAEAFVSSSPPPRRSVLFAAWNAEERGLLGSRYYVEKPTLPLETLAAVFQMDMIGRNEEIPDSEDPRFFGLPKQSADENRNSVNIMGYSRTQDLRRLAESLNRHIGLDLRFRYDDSASNLLRRSDNWPFLVRRVPALFFHTGLHPDYHQPTDTAEKINYEKMEKIVRLVFLCSWHAANATERPRLN